MKFRDRFAPAHEAPRLERSPISSVRPALSVRVICILAIALLLATCTMSAAIRSYSAGPTPHDTRKAHIFGRERCSATIAIRGSRAHRRLYRPRPIYDRSGSTEPSYSTSVQSHYTYGQPSYGTYSSGGGSGCSTGNYCGASTCVTGFLKLSTCEAISVRNGTYVRPHIGVSDRAEVHWVRAIFASRKLAPERPGTKWRVGNSASSQAGRPL